MTVVIRHGEKADVSVIAHLIRELARFEKLEHGVTMTEELLAANLFGPHRYAETLIAEDAGKPIGFALFFHTFSTFLGKPGLYLEDLFVVPDQRSHGVGRALLRQLARVALERGCGRLEWAVLNWNREAIKFYERLGARPNSDWTVYRLAGEALTALGREWIRHGSPSPQEDGHAARRRDSPLGAPSAGNRAADPGQPGRRPAFRDPDGRAGQGRPSGARRDALGGSGRPARPGRGCGSQTGVRNRAGIARRSPGKTELGVDFPREPAPAGLRGRNCPREPPLAG